MASKGTRYDKEFKSDITRLIMEENQSIAKVAKDFGISDQAIRVWIKAAEEKQNPEKNRIAELEAQLKEEKRKNSNLEQTVDILKKSVAIFIQDNQK
jgi:transposase